ncbi:MAG: methylmalonyl-CoA mutase, N-terminal domain, partial [Ilumatobacteraceae bacterium]|nr:methylmalonyl-CoA mutase, N-terminal domain [Ilumatobacteraceae bacterium]
PRLSFFFNAHIDFLEEIAKYRAARRVRARWLRDRYGAQLERSLQLRFNTQTAGVSLTTQHRAVNIASTAIEALAGGARRDTVAAHQLGQTQRSGKDYVPTAR